MTTPRKRNTLRRAGELVMIVVGVLIALAADAWWARRGDLHLATDYRARLSAELGDNRRLIDTLMVHTRHVQVATDSLVMALEDRVDIGGDVRVAVNAYNATRRLGQGFRTSTFDEMVSTGGLRILREPPVRAALAEVYGEFKAFPADWYGAEYRRAARRAVPSSIQLRIRSECTDITDQAWDACNLALDRGMARSTADALRADPEVLGSLRIQAHDISIFVRNLERTRVELDSTLALLRE